MEAQVIEVTESEAEVTAQDSRPNFIRRSASKVVSQTKKTARTTKHLVVDVPVVTVGKFVDDRLSMHAAKSEFRRQAVVTGKKLRSRKS